MTGKRETLQAEVTIYATFDRQDVINWWKERVSQEEPEDRIDYEHKYYEFAGEVSSNDNLQLYLNHGGTFDDTDVDHEEYFEHCFEVIA